MTFHVRDILRPAHETPAGERVIAVLPAYNAARTLERTLRDIPLHTVDEIILVDDCSADNTAELAESMGVRVIRHPRNRGYGGNQKTCYKAALEAGADYVIMVHPDYQYDSRVLPFAIGFIKLGICDVVTGCRIRTRREAIKGGMPLIKYLANRGLTFMMNIALGQNMGDFHSGFRAYKREVLERVPFELNSDDFVFDSQFLVQSVYLGFRLAEVPVPVRYFDEASSVSIKRSTIYAFITMGLLAEYWLHLLGIKKCRLLKTPVKKEESSLAGSTAASQR